MNHTVLYAARASALEDRAQFEDAYRLASEARRRKTDRLRREEDKRLSLCAELLLRRGLREAGVLSSEEAALPEIVCGPEGKPRLKEGGLCFNLSHSGEYALCAVSPVPVGCDVERIGEAELALAKRFFCPEEWAELAEIETLSEQNRLFFRWWTLKESFLKATGLGMKLPLNAFRLILPRDDSLIAGKIPGLPTFSEKPKTGVVMLHTEAGRDFPEVFDGTEYRFAEFGGLPGYGCAACTAGDGGDFLLRMTELF